MNSIGRTFVYVNVFAAALLDDEVISEYVSQQLRTTSWKGFKNDFGVIPAISNQQSDYRSFFDGISAEQYVNSRQDGIYVNAMYPGLMIDFNKWQKVVSVEDTDAVTFVYIDIPFEVYEKAEKGDFIPPDRDLYESQSKKLKAMVETLEAESKHVLN